MKIRFHWRLVQGGEVGCASRALSSSQACTGLPDLENQIAYCQAAEEAGIDSVLVDIGWPKPDPILLTAGLGLATKKIGFIIASRSGLIPPTTFVQQINTLSCLIGGERLMLNVVAGHSPVEQRFYGDFLDHDHRYARTEEFLAICRGLWQGTVDYSGAYFCVEGARLNTPFEDKNRGHPLMFIAGGSPASKKLSMSQGDCWMQLPNTPEKVSANIAPLLAVGKEAGLRLSVMVRPSREEALEAVRSMVRNLDPEHPETKGQSSFIKGTDSVSFRELHDQADTEWLTPTLWTGAVRTHGAPAICLVGDPEQVAEALMDYRRVGVTHFILSGWPKLEEMVNFGKHVLPLVREKEKEDALSAVPASVD